MRSIFLVMMALWPALAGSPARAADDFGAQMDARFLPPRTQFIAYYRTIVAGKPDEPTYLAANASWDANAPWIEDQIFNQGHSQTSCSHVSQQEGALLTVLGEIMRYRHGDRFFSDADARHTDLDMLTSLEADVNKLSDLDAGLYGFMVHALAATYVSKGAPVPAALERLQKLYP